MVLYQNLDKYYLIVNLRLRFYRLFARSQVLLQRGGAGFAWLWIDCGIVVVASRLSLAPRSTATTHQCFEFGKMGESVVFGHDTSVPVSSWT